MTRKLDISIFGRSTPIFGQRMYNLGYTVVYRIVTTHKMTLWEKEKILLMVLVRYHRCSQAFYLVFWLVLCTSHSARTIRLPEGSTGGHEH